ncbi:Ferric iron ABC transporter, iron-binding protein [Ruminococcaceae bacterium BL-6]|nr:Ferric iron ABC transporter, iron-binding protein [Ruminococcaceae bacterium BL-6]
MKRKIRFRFLALAAAVCLASLAGCGSGQAESQPATSSAAAGTESGKGDNTLVVYTARSDQLNDAIIPAFEKKTGIHVDVISGNTGECLKRVQTEASNPQGDILWAADKTMLSEYSSLFMKYVSPEDENMLDGFKNTTGYFSPAFADPTAIIVNKSLIGDIKVESFQDLLNPKLKGKISWLDPSVSSSSYQCLLAMLYGASDNGDPMSEKSWKFVDQFLDNTEGKFITTDVAQSVAEGEYAVGLTWEDPVVNYIRNGGKVELVFPKEGSIFPAESVQIINKCPHPESAKKFVDYMLSEEAQSYVGTHLNARPLRKGVSLGDYMVPTDQIVLSKTYNQDWVTKNKKLVTDTFVEHREKH